MKYRGRHQARRKRRIVGILEDWRHGRALLREFIVRPTPEEPGQVLVPCGFILEPFPEGR